MHITDVDDPDRVTMGQFRQALDLGADTVADCPRPLREFFATVERVPSWVDFDLVNEGAAAYRRLGTNAADVMLQLSLIGGYRFGGPTDLLVETGGLTGRKTVRRLAETQKWAVAVSQPDAMCHAGRASSSPCTSARCTRSSITSSRRTAAGTSPTGACHQPDRSGRDAGVVQRGAAAGGAAARRPGQSAESRAIMHLWKYVGWLVGVDEDWLCDNEAAQHRLNYHLLITQSGVSEAGPQLANAIVDAQRLLHYPNLAGMRGRYHRARLLSMLSYFLRAEGMRDLDLPRALPWAVAPAIAKNVVRYQLLARTGRGRAYLERWGARSSDRLLAKYFESSRTVSANSPRDAAAAARELGPTSLLWRWAGDMRIAFEGGTAGLLQTMHPAIGQGLIDHSDFFDDPVDRVFRSLPGSWAPCTRGRPRRRPAYGCATSIGTSRAPCPVAVAITPFSRRRSGGRTPRSSGWWTASPRIGTDTG